MHLNGINLGDYAVASNKAYAFQGIRERGQRGRLFVNEVADCEDEEIELMPLDAAVARKLAQHIKGAGETWFYQASTTSTGSKGTVPNSGGTYTITDANGPHTNCRVEVGSNSYIELPLREILQGKWTFRVYRYETIADDGAASNAWYRYVVYGTGTSQTGWWRNGVASGLVTPANWTTKASDGDFRLLGKDSDATNNAKYYSELEFWPFHVDSDWVADIDTEMTARAPAGLPFMNLVDTDDINFEPENVSTAIIVAGHVATAPRVKFGGAMKRVLRFLLQHKTSAT